MTLLDVVRDIDSFEEEYCICADRPWTIDSEAILGAMPEDGSMQAVKLMYGKEYFLEVFVAKDFLQDLNGSQAHPTLESKCERLILYAENDA